MKKNIFFFFCLSFFILNCSDITIEDDGDSRNDRRVRDDLSDDNKKSDDDLEENLNVCKGDSYTIYTPNDKCVEIQQTDTQYPDGSMENTDFDHDISAPTRPVDIFLVLNNSNSMWYYLSYATGSNIGFQGRFKSFIPTMNRYKLDWRIFFTHTDYSKTSWWGNNGKAIELEDRYNVLNSNVLDSTVNDYLNIFMYTLTRGPDRVGEPDRGDNYECSSYPPYCSDDVEPLKALKSSFSANKYLTRKEADFVAVIISNKDEKAPSIDAKEITNEFKLVYGSDKKLFVLSLIILPDDVNCYNKNNERTFFLFQPWQKPSYGREISKLAKTAGGGNFSICLDDYSILAQTIILNAQ